MEILLVVTDSSLDCGRAMEMLKELGEKFSAKVKILAVLEDIYRLERTGVSLGLPIPKETVPEAKRRVSEKIKTMWRQLGNGEVEIETVAGDLREEVVKYTSKKKPAMILWGCKVTPHLCRVIDEVEVPSLIIK